MHHEAGHAVAFYVNALRFREISIEPDEDFDEDTEWETAGRVTFAHPKWYRDAAEGSSSFRARVYMENFVIASMAGHLAQERHTQRSPEFETYESDLEQSLEHICRFVGSERTAKAYMQLLWEMARDLVEMESNWRANHASFLKMLSPAAQKEYANGFERQPSKEEQAKLQAVKQGCLAFTKGSAIPTEGFCRCQVDAAKESKLSDSDLDLLGAHFTQQTLTELSGRSSTYAQRRKACYQ